MPFVIEFCHLCGSRYCLLVLNMCNENFLIIIVRSKIYESRFFYSLFVYVMVFIFYFFLVNNVVLLICMSLEIKFECPN